MGNCSGICCAKDEAREIKEIMRPDEEFENKINLNAEKKTSDKKKDDIDPEELAYIKTNEEKVVKIQANIRGNIARKQIKNKSEQEKQNELPKISVDDKATHSKINGINITYHEPVENTNPNDKIISNAHNNSTTQNELVLKTKGNPEKVKLGQIVLENNAIYQGEWANAMRNGYGVQDWPDGSRYEGDWKDDKAHGKGKLWHSDGDVYEGDWVNDKANGVGKYTHSNGAIYQGHWKDDKQHGFGKEIWPDGAAYEGEYYEGKKNGPGVLKFADGSVYDGEFVMNEIQGKGKYVWPDGKVYIGGWYKNKMEGNGKLNWPDGRCYEGEYHEDKKHGKYVGSWFRGKQHGKGEYYMSNGEKKIGEWIEGKRIKWVDELPSTKENEI